MTVHAIKKGILLKHAFKQLDLELPIEIEFEIIDHLHHQCVNLIIKQWYRFIERKQVLVLRVLDWVSDVDRGIIIPFDFTYKLLKDCIKKITFFTDDHDWWSFHFKKMFKSLAPLENILYCENNNYVTSNQLSQRIEMIEDSLNNYNNNVDTFIDSSCSSLNDSDSLNNMYIDWFLIKNRYTFASHYSAYNYRMTKFIMNNNVRDDIAPYFSHTWLELFDKYNCPPEWIKFWSQRDASPRRDQFLNEISGDFNNDTTYQNWLTNVD